MMNKLPSQNKFYSPSTRGFYDRDVHGKNIPTDVVQITNGRWRELLAANARGFDIVPDKDGFPQAQPHVMSDSQRKASLPFRRVVALRRAGEAIERHRDEVALGHPTTLTDDQHRELVAYRHAVRAATDELPAAPATIAVRK